MNNKTEPSAIITKGISPKNPFDGRVEIGTEYKHWEKVFDATNNDEDATDHVKKAEAIDKSREPERLRCEQEGLRELHERYPDGVPGSLLGRD